MLVYKKPPRCLLTLLLAFLLLLPTVAYASTADENQPPVANAWVIGSEGLAKTGWAYTDLAVKFTAVGSYDPDGEIVKYVWDFGDNTSKVEGINVSHIYKVPGTYMVLLSVTDDKGASSTDACLVFVRESPYAVMSRAFSIGMGVGALVVFIGWIFFKIKSKLKKPPVFKPGFPTK